MDTPVTTSVFGVAELATPLLTREQLADKLIGARVDDRYRIEALLGQGGMGGVYKAVHIGLSKTVAIKVLWPELSLNRRALARFQREAKAASSLNHPGLVSVYDYGLLKDLQAPYLVMQYVEGKNLAEILQQERRFTVERSLNIFIQICDALSHAHEHGVIHRDVTPSNIILKHGKDGSETVQIVDFGIAMVMSPFNPEQAITHAGEVAGSPHYMSPEQCLSEYVDCRSDIYSLSCVMFETLTGSPAFIGNTAMHTMYKQMHEEPDFSEFQKLGLPVTLKRILEKGLNKKRESRYQSMADLQVDLVKVREQIFRSISHRLIRWQSQTWQQKVCHVLILFMFVSCCAQYFAYLFQSAKFFLHVP